MILTVAVVDKDRKEALPLMEIAKAQDPAVFPFTLKPADVLATEHVFDLVETLMTSPSFVKPFFAAMANVFPFLSFAATAGSAGDDNAFEATAFGELFESDVDLGACVAGVSALPP